MGDNLFYVSRAGIFSIYPNILKKIVAIDDEAYSSDKCFILLPSDFEWQLKCYFRLLEQQKKINSLSNKSIVELSQIEPLPPITGKDEHTEIERQESEIIMETYSPISPSADRNLIKPLGFCEQEFRLSVSHENNNVMWDLAEFAKAGKLLKVPAMEVNFFDEYEMRKVYSLVYDVFRFKLVLNKTLESIEFFNIFPELKKDLPRVWLLLYDLYLRTFSKRKPELLPLKDKLFKESEMLYIESCLDEMKTKLAASITKIRIEKQALNLQLLLPVHLRDEKVARAVQTPIITGWINKFMHGSTKKEVIRKFEVMGFKELKGCDVKSTPKSFRFDKLCPNFFYLWFPREKSEFSQDVMVVNKEIILQNKAFTVGPAMFAKLINYYEIGGDILQTHILSPRSTLYLASLLFGSKFVGKFRVFGAGNNFKEYQAYFDKIGAKNIKLYQESFLSCSRNILEKTVAIYCTPPSSFSSIQDPIELICSRGGDLKMLQFLSESEMNDEGQSRATKILQEQRDTLKCAMSKPQIQFILYETHSIVEAENEEMVKTSMEYVNRKAFDKHMIKAQKERERLEQLEREKENMPGIPGEKKKDSKGGGGKKGKEGKMNTGESNESINEIEGGDDQTAKFKKDEPLEVKVPDTDIFDVVQLPDFCLNKDNCVLKRSEGCFLSLIRRREIVRMDSKYLIQIAELRGIFGDKDRPKKVKSKAQLRAEKKQEAAMRAAREALERQKSEKAVPSNVDKIMERLLKPTQSTIIRLTRDEIWRRKYHFMALRYSFVFPPRCARCDYYSQNEDYLSENFSVSDEENFAFQLSKRRASKWWNDLYKHIKQLKIIASISGVEMNEELFEKNILPPLKIVRFPQGFIAPPLKREKSMKEYRRQYSLSVTILDIDQPMKRIKFRSRSITTRMFTLKKAQFNRCFLCMHEFLHLTGGYDQMCSKMITR